MAHWEAWSMVKQVMTGGLAGLSTLAQMGWRMLTIEGAAGALGYLKGVSRGIARRGHQAVREFEDHPVAGAEGPDMGLHGTVDGAQLDTTGNRFGDDGPVHRLGLDTTLDSDQRQVPIDQVDGIDGVFAAYRVEQPARRAHTAGRERRYPPPGVLQQPRGGAAPVAVLSLRSR